MSLVPWRHITIEDGDHTHTYNQQTVQIETICNPKRILSVLPSGKIRPILLSYMSSDISGIVLEYYLPHLILGSNRAYMYKDYPTIALQPDASHNLGMAVYSYIIRVDEGHYVFLPESIDYIYSRQMMIYTPDLIGTLLESRAFPWKRKERANVDYVPDLVIDQYRNLRGRTGCINPEYENYFALQSLPTNQYEFEFGNCRLSLTIASKYSDCMCGTHMDNRYTINVC